jgi:putative transcriptional regulator
VRNRLRVLRAERDWSQSDLATHLAVSRQTVNAIETGKYAPSLPLAFQIARLFALPIEAIFFPNDFEQETDTQQQTPASLPEPPVR